MSLGQYFTFISFAFITLSSSGIEPWSPENPNCKWPYGEASSAVSFTYDDALISQLDNGAPFLKSKGIRGSFFVMKSKFDSRFAKLEEFGHEVSGHSARCDVSEGVVAEGRQLLVEMNAFEYEDSYAYPCGRLQLRKWLPKYGFFGARGVSGVVNNYGFDRWNVGSFSLFEKSDLDKAREHYQRARVSDGWAVYHLHHVKDVSKSYHDTIVEEVVKTSDVWIAPFGVVLKCAHAMGYTL